MQLGLATGSTCKRPQFVHSHTARTVFFLVSQVSGSKIVTESAPRISFSDSLIARKVFFLVSEDSGWEK